MHIFLIINITHIHYKNILENEVRHSRFLKNHHDLNTYTQSLTLISVHAFPIFVQVYTSFFLFCKIRVIMHSVFNHCFFPNIL